MWETAIYAGALGADPKVGEDTPAYAPSHHCASAEFGWHEPEYGREYCGLTDRAGGQGPGFDAEPPAHDIQCGR
jgi:hypothetical protein